MKELKRTVTTESVYGYEANDGTFFSSKEECQKYEQSARFVIRNMAKSMIVRDSDCDSLFGGFNYEDTIYVWDIKDAEHLRIVNQFLRDCDYDYDSVHRTAKLTPAHIGRRVAVVVNTECDYVYALGSYDEILSNFVGKLNKLFADPTTKADA